MSLLEEIKQQVNDITDSHELGKDYKGFGYWFLEEIEDFGQEEAEDLVTDGAWDKGRDAVYWDEDEGRLTIYQFKYSEKLSYAKGAFTDIQSGLQAEEDKLADTTEVRLVVVTTATADQDLQKAARLAQRRVRSWLTKNGYKGVQASVELIDLNQFRQVFEKLYGVNLTLDFKQPPLLVDEGALGLVDASLFQDHVENEALFAFNIRKFLGLRKGSVNWQMKQTLEQEEDRDEFWTFNNGIVCLSTEIKEVKQDESQLDVDNFTIVNGAQTINTIARFLNENPAITEPIWVSVKIIEVAENDLDRARTLTRTSNTQTPTSNKDLRAVDLVHRRLEKWFDEFFSLTYVYRRGVRPPMGAKSIGMKDVLQAFAAYQREEPEMAFSKVGQLFSSDVEYDAAFPSEEVNELRNVGTQDAIAKFLTARVLPWRLLDGIRTSLQQKAKDGLDKKWKSTAYHVLWLYKKLFELESIKDEEQILDLADEVLDKTADGLIDAFIAFCANRDEDIPRALKKDQLTKALSSSGFFEQPLILTVRGKLRAIF